jgi:hypothetical protein
LKPNNILRHKYEERERKYVPLHLIPQTEKIKQMGSTIILLSIERISESFISSRSQKEHQTPGIRTIIP